MQTIHFGHCCLGVACELHAFRVDCRRGSVDTCPIYGVRIVTQHSQQSACIVNRWRHRNLSAIGLRCIEISAERGQHVLQPSPRLVLWEPCCSAHGDSPRYRGVSLACVLCRKGQQASKMSNPAYMLPTGGFFDNWLMLFEQVLLLAFCIFLEALAS